MRGEKELCILAALCAAFAACAATSVKTDRFDKYGNPKPLMTVFKVTPIEKRIEKIKPVAKGELRVRPTFNACGIVWGADETPGIALEWRRKGDGAWRPTPPMPWFGNVKNYRGSILGLDDDAAYEFRIVTDGKTLAQGNFTTWKSDVPVAKTVTIDPATVKFPLKIDGKGSPDGWIRYTLPKGAVLDAKGADLAVDVDGAEHVLLDDMAMKGGRGREFLTVRNSKGVRIRNCDIWDFGRDASPDYARKGLWYELANPKVAVNFDGAIVIKRGSSEVVVERCYVHDAHSRANSWYYAHPAGPDAVIMECPDHSTVLRWNDFVGSDIHPWNDAVEGAGNFIDDGGFNRDADVNGNFMIYAADDNIELDGGQQNVRCWGNRFEAAGCGVSIQGCMVSPVYVYDNLFTGLAEEHHLVMQTIKTSSYEAFGNGSWCWIADNTFWGAGTGVNVSPIKDNPLSLVARWDVRNNRFAGPMQRLTGVSEAKHFHGEGNVFESVAFDERKLDASYPKRPLGFLLDRARVSVKAPFAPLTVKAKSTDAKPIPFTVRINRDFDWFTVSPSSGVIPAGGEVTFTVTFRKELMEDRRRYRGAFLVRTENGLSRPVSVHATTDFEPPYRPVPEGANAVYAKGFERGSYVQASKEWKTYDFTIPSDGTWYFLIHGCRPDLADDITTGNRQLLEVQVDGEEPALSYQQVRNYPIWTLLMPGKRFGNFACPFELKSGRHTVKIRLHAGMVLYDGVVATRLCGAFEPR